MFTFKKKAENTGKYQADGKANNPSNTTSNMRTYRLTKYHKISLPLFHQNLYFLSNNSKYILSRCTQRFDNPTDIILYNTINQKPLKRYNNIDAAKKKHEIIYFKILDCHTKIMCSYMTTLHVINIFNGSVMYKVNYALDKYIYHTFDQLNNDVLIAAGVSKIYKYDYRICIWDMNFDPIQGKVLNFCDKKIEINHIMTLDSRHFGCITKFQIWVYAYDNHELNRILLLNHKSLILKYKLSHDKKYIVTLGDDHRIHVWDWLKAHQINMINYQYKDKYMWLEVFTLTTPTSTTLSGFYGDKNLSNNNPNEMNIPSSSNISSGMNALNNGMNMSTSSNGSSLGILSGNVSGVQAISNNNIPSGGVNSSMNGSITSGGSGVNNIITPYSSNMIRNINTSYNNMMVMSSNNIGSNAIGGMNVNSGGGNASGYYYSENLIGISDKLIDIYDILGNKIKMRIHFDIKCDDYLRLLKIYDNGTYLILYGYKTIYLFSNRLINQLNE